MKRISLFVFLLLQFVHLEGWGGNVRTEIRLDDEHILQEAAKGDLCAIPVPEKVRRGDRVYLFK